MIKKRLFKAALMAASLALSGMTAMAASSGKCGENLTWTLDDEGALVVTGTGAMYNYDDEMNEKWDKTLIKTVQIGPAVTTIGTYAFSGCESLTKVTLFNNALTTIGDFAFMWCINMKSITVSNSVKTIKQYAFAQCKALEDVVIGKSVSDIGMGVFSQCGALKSIKVKDGNMTYDSRDDCNAIIHKETTELVRGCQNTVIPNTVTSIGVGAFSDGYGLESIYIPNSVTSIKNSAFFKCKDLKHVTIGASVVSIGKYAFQECFSLRSVAMGASVASIEDAAFAHCRSLAKLTVVAADPPICGTKGVFTGVNKNVCKLIVPSASVDLYKAAFEWKDFVNVETLAGIGKCGDNLYWALYNNGELEITGYGAMYDYEYYDTRPKWDKDLVKTVRIEGAATNIGNRAFERSPNLTDIKMPNTITKIGSSAFSSCYALTDMALPNTVTELGSWAYSHCRSLTKVHFPKALIGIGLNALVGCENVTSMEVEQGNPVFDSRDNCNAIIRSATNTLVAGCQTTVIPNTVTSIGRSAFYDCANLTNITIPTSVTTIEEAAFYRCRKLREVEIPDMVTTIGEAAFTLCQGLVSVKIPDNVVSLGKEAFEYCHDIKTLVLGSSLADIGDNAFHNCYKLKEITVKATTPPTCGTKGVFTGVNKDVCKLIVPSASVDLYKAAFEWKDFKNIILGTDDLVADGGISVLVSGHTISVLGADTDAEVEVYGISGMAVYRGTDKTVTVPASGVYVVRVAGKAFKTVVK